MKIIGAFLMALGVLTFYFLDRGLKGDKEGTKLLILSILSFFAGAWILFSGITMEELKHKFYGGIMAIVGYFLALHFPDVVDYQNEAFAKTAMFFGLILFILGVYWLLF